MAFNDFFGDLILIGDSAPNAITISAAGTNSVWITPSNSTTVSGRFFLPTVDPVSMPLFRNLIIKLGKGDDTISFALPPGNNNVLSIPGNLTIDYGLPGAGDGNKITRTINAADNSLFVQGNFTIRYANGNVTTTLNNLEADHNLTVAHGVGDSTFRLDNQRTTQPFSHVGGNLTIRNMQGKADNQIIDTNVDFNIAISNGNPRKADNQAGRNWIYNSLANTTRRATVGGNIVIQNLAGDHTGEVGDKVADVDVNGSVTLKLGTGKFNAMVAAEATDGLGSDLTIGGSLNIASGWAGIRVPPPWTETITLGVAGGSGLTVRGNMSLRSGNGDSAIDIHDVSVFKATSIFTGAGVDTVGIDTVGGDTGSFFGGNFTMGLGPSADTLTIASDPGALTRFMKAVNVKLGDGADTLLMASLAGGGGFVDFEAPSTLGVVFDGGTGVDTRNPTADMQFAFGSRIPKFLNFP